MLRSLFGDLYALRDAHKTRPQDPFPPTEFAATAVLEHASRTLEDGGQLIDRRTQDLFVTGSPASGMRAHFAAMLEAAPVGQRFITLVDPAQMWAGSVIKALSEAGGQPIERLHLRDQATLQTLARIERTTMHRRSDETLKVYHADVRAQGRDAAAIAVALMERADLTVFIVGPMHPSVIEEQIRTLHREVQAPTWACPEVLFLLPLGARWIADRLDRMVWPAGVRVRSVVETMTSASAVWNTLLAHWHLVRPATGRAGAPQVRRPTDAPPPSALSRPSTASAPAALGSAAPPVSGLSGPEPSGFGAFPALHELPMASAPMPLYPEAPSVTARPETERPPVRSRPHPSLRQLDATVETLSQVDGVLFVAVVDVASAFVLAAKGSNPSIGTLAEIGQRVTDLVQAHRASLTAFGHPRRNDPVDEILVTSGSAYHVLRSLQSDPDCFVVGIADKLRSNLAMTRFRILEAQKALG